MVALARHGAGWAQPQVKQGCLGRRPRAGAPQIAEVRGQYEQADGGNTMAHLPRAFHREATDGSYTYLAIEALVVADERSPQVAHFHSARKRMSAA
jgi:hypothetical protein